MPFQLNRSFFRDRYLCVALCCLAIAACGKTADPAKPGAASDAAASLAVTMAHAEERPVERSVIASGPVAAWEEMQLGVEVSGMRVTALNVDVGQSVHKGDVLLEVDHRTLDSDLHQMDAAVQEAQAGVALASSNLARGKLMAKNQLIAASAFDALKAEEIQAEAK